MNGFVYDLSNTRSISGSSFSDSSHIYQLNITWFCGNAQCKFYLNNNQVHSMDQAFNVPAWQDQTHSVSGGNWTVKLDGTINKYGSGLTELAARVCAVYK